MTTIRALPSMPNLTSLNIEKISYRSPDSIASDFHSLLQTQVKLSRSHGSILPGMQKQSASMSPHRSDIDSMLAQLLASRKMLLHTKNPVSVSGKTNREDLTECSMADNSCIETAEVSNAEYARVPVSDLCSKINKDHIASRGDPECHAHISDHHFACQQPFPAVVMAPLTNIFIWISPEIIRFPFPFYRGQPLRIRRLRLLNRIGYRQDGNNRNEVG
ncbi:hypothetical protein [Pantoea alhagi]|uniref:hypothetical protein n=1 Tax=Pantoea alhagi TaxID=1891675 RepID=UPI0012F508CA|nr:hypothetical protein [Pantoea alhagi]